MNVEQERSRSLWMEVPAPRFGPLASHEEADVLVIGAGIMGLSAAYELAKEGRQVTVVDRGRFGRGMTARTSAHLAFDTDDYFKELIKGQGRERARLWYESQKAAVDRIEAICLEEGIDCDFARVDGFFIPAKQEDVDYLRQELDAAHEAGFADAEWLEPGALSWLNTAAIRFPRQARFHPLKYLNGLIRALQGMGARLHDETPLRSVEEKDGRVRVEAEIGGGSITARQAVVATNSPYHLRIPIHTKQAPYRTYVIAAPVPKGSAPDALIWDTEEPGYHYVRIQPGETEDLLIVGGEDHKTGTADDGEERVRRLEAWTRERNPQMGPVAYAWSGQVYEPADYVGFIGKSPNHEAVFVATGDSGQGLTTGALAGLMLRDLVQHRENPWAELYDPSRQQRRGLGEYVKENVEAAKHWLELAGSGEVGSVEQIAPGEGALVKVKGQQIAAYRDDQGRLHLRSAVCTHAGCVVHWNGFETCWDCPCHGSQFSVDGEPLNGPAFQPLAVPEDAIAQLRLEGTLDSGAREVGQDGERPQAGV